MSRRKARSVALKILFQKEFQNRTDQEALEYFSRQPEYKMSEKKHLTFALEILKGCRSHRKHIDEVIESISQNWTVKRMSFIDLNIMRIAIFEIFYRPDIPKNTSINEAVELAKIYGCKESPSFVNGILDKVSKQPEIFKEKE